MEKSLKRDTANPRKLMFALYRLNAHKRPVVSHSSNQQHMNGVHTCMYKLEKKGHMVIHRYEIDDPRHTLFKLEITMEGVDYIRGIYYKRYILLFAIIAAIGAIFAIAGYYKG